MATSTLTVASAAVPVSATPVSNVTAPTVAVPDVEALLTAAVHAVGGTDRPGQILMADAVDRAIRTGEHLAVQAGTGTGKSLAYLVPALRHAVSAGSTVVVSTATIALQRQLVERDLPRLVGALEPLLGDAPSFAILKGRRNYLCRHRLNTGPPDEGEDLFDAASETSPTSMLGRQIARLHEWSEQTETGDRDELVPGVTERAWRQVSVSARECLGVSRCPAGMSCFAEQARARAGRAEVVVTNHALLAIDAMGENPVLPDHAVVIVDEAHDLVDRVTNAATEELTAPMVETAARRCGPLIDQQIADELAAAGDGLALLLGDAPVQRWDTLGTGIAGALTAVRDAAHRCTTALGTSERREDPDAAARRRLAQAALEQVHSTAARVLAAFPESADPEAHRRDVVWLAEETVRGRVLRVAPLSVAGLLRQRLFAERTVILTSATLTLGGTFDALAAQWGLPLQRPSPAAAPAITPGTATERPAPADDDEGLVWTGLDAGSPFEFRRAGILYIAAHLPPPGRDGLPPAYLDELHALVTAAGGRTLGLFSSMRAAKHATEELRSRLDLPILCQGDDATGLLITQFAQDEPTCLFGTLSLWQGVDVPGRSLSLVVVDRIPFPRPDDPLSSARQRAAAAHGGNGFLAVAATHAALLLAQGAGRLLRSTTDRGVVAILDPRLATARYSGFLRASLPPFWPTTDAAVAQAALRRLVSA
ncbi:MAG TPA: ATP-dependent DNA helicase [Pseudonocardiaceae bacterium]|nr:ATP-dependent DNA helicase [Pseudonocardiaceae bacterium]